MNSEYDMATRADEGLVSAIPTPVWILIFGAVGILVARRLGAFDLWATVVTPSGATVRFPNGLALVDHPFHAVRAESLRRALFSGHMLRWIGNHQGGYPAEFYPLGVAALDVVAWALAFGTLPMMAIHKLVVIAIFLAPMIGYAMIAGFDRRSLGVALLASAGHLCVRGWWWSGGAMELYEWGLVTNVAAVTALVIALPLIVRYVDAGRRWTGAIAVLLSAFALVTNPRSGIALATIFVGAVLAVMIQRRNISSFEIRRLAVRTGIVALATALIAAPELLALLRFSHLYYFVHYSDYADLHAYWQSSIQAVGGPAFVLGIAGGFLAALPGARLHHRAVAVTLASYVACTALMVSGNGPNQLISQLELPRLMPFQRFLWFILAAIAVEWVVKNLLRWLHMSSLAAVGDVVFILLTAIVFVLYVLRPPGFIPVGDRGLVSMPTSANPGIVDLEDAVKLANARAANGTALLVLGTVLSWHDQLWSPLWSDRPFYYNDWLWYWQTKNFGAYNPKVEHDYPNPATALEPEYLERHGIGAVIVTGPTKTAARQDSRLTSIRTGTWDVYLVNAPTTIVTFSGNSAQGTTIGDGTIEATGIAEGGEIVIRRNWFPRWKATIDGKSVAIHQTDDGYMSISTPGSGQVQVMLTYEVDWIDWVGRIAALIGLVIVVFMFLPERAAFRLRSKSTRSVPRAIPKVQSARQ